MNSWVATVDDTPIKMASTRNEFNSIGKIRKRLALRFHLMRVLIMTRGRLNKEVPKKKNGREDDRCGIPDVRFRMREEHERIG